MAGGRRAIRQRLVRFGWLAGLAALVVVLACVLVIPQWLVQWELGAAARTLTAADKAKAINDVRATLLQGIGGAVLLLGAYFTYRQLQTGREQLQIVQQGQVTERFTRAIDQLGRAELDVRLGGIYALERIANDSPDDRPTIVEVLTAFVRGHAPWPPRLEGQPLADAPIGQVPELQLRAPDVQAALTVLARRQPPPTPSGRLDPRATDLRKASLDRANLQEAIFDRAQLQEASLVGTNLQGATLVRANLEGARLVGANLEGAHLGGAKLQAFLDRANLQGALIGRAQLQGAFLDDAQLQRAALDGSQLQGASLRGAQLQGAYLGGANFQEANLDGAQLTNAHISVGTIWPAGFNPRRAGVGLVDRQADTADKLEDESEG